MSSCVGVGGGRQTRRPAVQVTAAGCRGGACNGELLLVFRRRERRGRSRGRSAVQASSIRSARPPPRQSPATIYLQQWCRHLATRRPSPYPTSPPALHESGITEEQQQTNAAFVVEIPSMPLLSQSTPSIRPDPRLPTASLWSTLGGIAASNADSTESATTNIRLSSFSVCPRSKDRIQPLPPDLHNRGHR